MLIMNYGRLTKLCESLPAEMQATPSDLPRIGSNGAKKYAYTKTNLPTTCNHHIINSKNNTNQQHPQLQHMYLITSLQCKPTTHEIS